jgi:hypothetical protein
VSEHFLFFESSILQHGGLDLILRGFGILQAANPLERSLDQTRGAQTRSAQTRSAQTRGARHRTSHWPQKARDTGTGLRRLPCSGSFNYYTPHGLCQRSGRHRGRSVCQHTHTDSRRVAEGGGVSYLHALQLHLDPGHPCPQFTLKRPIEVPVRVHIVDAVHKRPPLPT